MRERVQLPEGAGVPTTSLTSCSSEAEALRERGLRRRSARGTRSTQGPDAARWAELAGGGAARRAEGTPPRSVRLCICMVAAGGSGSGTGGLPRRVAADGVGGFLYGAARSGRRGGGGGPADNATGCLARCGWLCRCKRNHVGRRRQPLWEKWNGREITVFFFSFIYTSYKWSTVSRGIPLFARYLKKKYGW